MGGDKVDVVRRGGRLRGRVGGDWPQTPESYHASVKAKFPPGDYDRLQRAFRRVWKTYRPQALRGGLVYDLYDQWKRTCGVGRRVDLDCLLQWCEERASAAV